MKEEEVIALFDSSFQKLEASRHVHVQLSQLTEAIRNHVSSVNNGGPEPESPEETEEPTPEAA